MKYSLIWYGELCPTISTLSLLIALGMDVFNLLEALSKVIPSHLLFLSLGQRYCLVYSIVSILILYHSFFMHPKGRQINHMNIADDVIIFTSRKRRSFKLIMQTLTTYKSVSG